MAYFDKYGVEFSDDRKTLVKCPEVFKGEYIIPNSVTSIGRSAFFGCTTLTSVTIPNSVMCIGMSVFEDCRNLHNVNIAKSKSHVNKNAYDKCGNRIPKFSCNGLNHIGGWAFKNCYNLQNINLPHGLESIGPQAFYNCCNLSSITIPNTVVKIGNEAFYNCSGLTDVYLLNKNQAIDLGDSIFHKEKGITILVPQNQANRITTALGNLSIYIDIKESIDADILYLKHLFQYYFGTNDSDALLLKSIKQDDIVELRKSFLETFSNKIKDELLLEIDSEHSVVYRLDEATVKLSGIEIPNEIYQVFIDSKEELPQHLWASSGKPAFDKMQDQNGLCVGNFTLRLGYYKVCDIKEDEGDIYLVCLYNLRDANYFVDELVKVKMSPLYNRISLGCIFQKLLVPLYPINIKGME